MLKFTGKTKIIIMLDTVYENYWWRRKLYTKLGGYINKCMILFPLWSIYDALANINSFSVFARLLCFGADKKAVASRASWASSNPTNRSVTRTPKTFCGHAEDTPEVQLQLLFRTRFLELLLCFCFDTKLQGKRKVFGAPNFWSMQLLYLYGRGCFGSWSFVCKRAGLACNMSRAGSAILAMLPGPFVHTHFPRHTSAYVPHIHIRL